MTGASLIASGRVPRMHRTFIRRARRWRSFESIVWKRKRFLRSHAGVIWAGPRGQVRHTGRRGGTSHEPARDLSDLTDQDPALPEDARGINAGARGRGEPEAHEAVEELRPGDGPTDDQDDTDHEQGRAHDRAQLVANDPPASPQLSQGFT